MRFLRLSIAAKLRLLTTGAVLVTTLVVLGVAVSRAISDSADRLTRKGETLAHMVAQSSEFAVYTQNTDGLRQISQSLRADSEVAYVRFLAADGHEIYGESLLPGVRLPKDSGAVAHSKVSLRQPREAGSEWPESGGDGGAGRRRDIGREARCSRTTSWARARPAAPWVSCSLASARSSRAGSCAGS